MKVSSQAQSLLLNNKDLKPKASAAQEKSDNSKATKVEELKELVAKGEYKVDINKTAQAMLNEFVR